MIRSDAENFDPAAHLAEIAERLLDREMWTYPEALYWIAFRNVNRVAERVGDGSEWKGVQASFIRACFFSDLMDMAAEEAKEDDSEGGPRDRPRDAVSGPTVQALLIDRLRRGKIKARGRLQGCGLLVDIPTDEWGDLTLDDGPGLPATVNAWHERHKGDPAKLFPWWSDVVFSRDGLMSAFPPMTLAATEASSSAATHSKKGTAGGEKRAEAELRRMAVAHSKGEGPVPVGASWREDAEQRHALTERGARRVWDVVARDFPALSERKGKPRRDRQK